MCACVPFAGRCNTVLSFSDGYVYAYVLQGNGMHTCAFQHVQLQQFLELENLSSQFQFGRLVTSTKQYYTWKWWHKSRAAGSTFNPVHDALLLYSTVYDIIIHLHGIHSAHTCHVTLSLKCSEGLFLKTKLANWENIKKFLKKLTVTVSH